MGWPKGKPRKPKNTKAGRPAKSEKKIKVQASEEVINKVAEKIVKGFFLMIDDIKRLF